MYKTFFLLTLEFVSQTEDAATGAASIMVNSEGTYQRIS